ncbi:antibiotic biosynthesis monooxygenase [Pannus brasiliensis CCIBt3594]|uniref:Antibiotic biosynthesis monooxygenase n=1 Tax=Pannus brasiliensis CCIBt3594 TaxID=1427578 RepID=A0AAW9QI82_9CHRO
MSQTDTSRENILADRSNSCASLVIEHRVARGKEGEFQQWQESLTSAVTSFPGYLRTDLSPPVTGAQDKWYAIVYFDTPENLNRWVDSSERRALVKKGEELFGSYQYRSLKTGLESWFTPESDEAEVTIPAWKQNSIVLLGLYPTVMLQTILFSALGVMSSWPLSVSMLVNNFICCSLLTWIVMPPLSRWFNFWIKDRAENSRAIDLAGLSIVSILLLALTRIFYTIADRDPLFIHRTLEIVYHRFLG